MQAAIGSAYIILNGLYWLTSLVEKKYFWNMHSYDCKRQEKEEYMYAHQDTSAYGSPSYTRTLWYAIHETKETGWVGRAGAAPLTDGWKKWLAEAQEHVDGPLDEWDAVGRKDILVGITNVEDAPNRNTRSVDIAKMAENAAPSEPIPVQSRR